MVRPERLLAASPLVLRFATDRRCAARGSVQPGADAGLSNSACLSAGSSNYYVERSKPRKGSQTPKIMVRPERFELPASWFVARRSIQLSYGRALTIIDSNTWRRGRDCSQACACSSLADARDR